jgi:hypothetical protein
MDGLIGIETTGSFFQGAEAAEAPPEYSRRPPIVREPPPIGKLSDRIGALADEIDWDLAPGQIQAGDLSILDAETVQPFANWPRIAASLPCQSNCESIPSCWSLRWRRVRPPLETGPRPGSPTPSSERNLPRWARLWSELGYGSERDSSSPGEARPVQQKQRQARGWPGQARPPQGNTPSVRPSSCVSR